MSQWQDGTDLAQTPKGTLRTSVSISLLTAGNKSHSRQRHAGETFYFISQQCRSYPDCSLDYLESTENITVCIFVMRELRIASGVYGDLRTC